MKIGKARFCSPRPLPTCFIIGGGGEKAAYIFCSFDWLICLTNCTCRRRRKSGKIFSILLIGLFVWPILGDGEKAGKIDLLFSDWPLCLTNRRRRRSRARNGRRRRTFTSPRTRRWRPKRRALSLNSGREKTVNFFFIHKQCSGSVSLDPYSVLRFRIGSCFSRQPSKKPTKIKVFY